MSSTPSYSAVPSTISEQAFQTILRNRINRGGILASQEVIRNLVSRD